MPKRAARAARFSASVLASVGGRFWVKSGLAGCSGAVVVVVVPSADVLSLLFSPALLISVAVAVAAVSLSVFPPVVVAAVVVCAGAAAAAEGFSSVGAAAAGFSSTAGLVAGTSSSS
jgi:hypothetical protein